MLLFCWLGWVFDFHDLILFSFTKGRVGAELGLDGTQLAWIEGVGLFASAIGGFVFGRVADRVGRRRAMTASILVYSFGAVCTAVATGFGSLLFARVLAGLGVGAEWGIGHAVVAETFTGRARDRAHGLLQAGSPVGMALAACSGLALAPVLGWRTVFLLAGLPALLVFVARRAMPGPARVPVASIPVSARELFATPHRRASLVLLALLVVHMTGFWCVYAELPAALLRDQKATTGQALSFQLLVNAAHLVADVAFGVLAARFSRERVFVSCCALAVLAQAAMALSWDRLAGDLAWFTFAAATAALAAGTWSSFGAWFGVHYPVALRATAAAVLYSTSRGAQLVAKPACHALERANGSMQPALWVGVGCSLLSLALVPLLPRRAVTDPSGADSGLGPR